MLSSIQHLYKKAQRTALLAQDNLTNKWYHVFSVIELLPCDVPDYNIPDDSWYGKKIIRSTQSSKSNDYSFSIIIHSFSSVKEAIATFEFPKSGMQIDGTENYFLNSSFIKEPTGDYPLILDSNSFKTNGLLGVLPKHSSGSLLWTQIDNARITENQFKGANITVNMRAISQLTQEWLGFDICTTPEHIGNIYLNAVNPYYRDLDLTLSHNPIGILYHFYLRDGVNETFSVRVIDKHGDYLALDKLYNLESPIGFIELPHEPNQVELRIYNRNGDLIGVDGPFAFLKSINFSMQIKQADFHVIVNDNNGKKEFVTEKYSSGKPFNAGDAEQVNMAYYFKTAEGKRKHIQLAESREFVFLPASHSELNKNSIKTKASNTIKEIINGARDICILCDPYFSVTDLIDYVFTVKSTGVKIQILNKRGKSFIDVPKAKELSNAIDMYNEKPFQKIECRTLIQSLLHDRFIIADNNVWFLGSSFNEIGNRATCIGKVPESVNIEIIKEIERWWYSDNYTEPLESYIKNSTDGEDISE